MICVADCLGGAHNKIEDLVRWLQLVCSIAQQVRHVHMQQQTRNQHREDSCAPVHVTPFSPDFDSSSHPDQLPSALAQSAVRGKALAYP